ncbi:DUF488 family protein [Rhizosaccharibacter radicis]|uniref:DUF488 domain-containing protein n=1 Tax=Rhizosaccharibacter radicis TaxID=2782605 RepID=A0ABT1VYG5_9PROT|nr:DUF488 domain-containing protein [Acetobacteraceae bacterium KSS12]
MPAPTLMTIGYEGISFDSFRQRLIEARCELLIDVRAIAASRRPGFSKTLLANGLAEAGIDYLHLQPLGTPKDGRDAVRRGDIATMHRIFAAHMEGDRPQAALAEATAAAGQRRACLLCFERDHRECHRTLVAEAIVGRSGQPVEHLEISLPPELRPSSRKAPRRGRP